MKVVYALLANYAEFAPDGKLTVVSGDIHELSGSFPYIAPPLILVAKIMLAQDECLKEHAFTVDILHPDREITALVQGTAALPKPAKSGRTKSGFILEVRMQGFVFPIPGKYEIQISLDGTVLESVSLFLDQAVSQPPQATEK